MKIYSYRDCVDFNKQKFNTVLHIGANKGQEINEYTECGVKKVIWVEALEELMRPLEINTKNSPIEQQYKCQVLSDIDDEEVVFNIADNEGQSSSMLSFGTHKDYAPFVKMIDQKVLKTKKFSTFAKQENLNLSEIEFINLDVQGAELKVLKGFDDIFENFRNIKGIFCEVNFEEVYIGCPIISEIDNFLLKFNFNRVFTHRFSDPWGDAYYHREYNDYK